MCGNHALPYFVWPARVAPSVAPSYATPPCVLATMLRICSIFHVSNVHFDARGARHINHTAKSTRKGSRGRWDLSLEYAYSRPRSQCESSSRGSRTRNNKACNTTVSMDAPGQIWQQVRASVLCIDRSHRWRMGLRCLAHGRRSNDKGTVGQAFFCTR